MKKLKINHVDSNPTLLEDTVSPVAFTVGKGDFEHGVFPVGKRWVVLIPYKGWHTKKFNSTSSAIKFINETYHKVPRWKNERASSD